MKRYLKVAGLLLLVWLARAAASGGVAFGMRAFTSPELRRAVERGKPVSAIVFGIASIDASVSTAEAAAGINRLRIFGIFQSTQQVRAALWGRVSVTGTILDAHEPLSPDFTT